MPLSSGLQPMPCGSPPATAGLRPLAVGFPPSLTGSTPPAAGISPHFPSPAPSLLGARASRESSRRSLRDPAVPEDAETLRIPSTIDW